MGKDQDLLDAARCGNISVVERILNQRAKKTGPLASLRRGPGPNIQDSSGYTPLHHAALNGHKDIVTLLLNHEAQSNIVDNKGCTPLHLASWSGNTEIVKLLLTHGSSVPSVNHMNFDHESALHSAAQYGHTEICRLLIQHNCYPSVRNIRNESPLDLASQYGRLETVQCLLNLHPELLNDFVRSHSPLHLASKNGHKHVVKALLDSGFNVNFMTEVGTSLHEAAMYGKIEVVKLLLEYGVDVNIENSRKRTVFDILLDLNTSIARQIEDVIKDHMTLIKLDTDSNESIPAILPPRGFVSGDHFVSLVPEKSSLSNISPPQQFCSSPEESLYEIPPPPKMMNKSLSGGNESLSSLTLSHSHDSSFDQASCSSCSPSKCDSSDLPIYENSSFQGVKQDAVLYESPVPQALFGFKRYSDPLQHSAVYENICPLNTCENMCKGKMFDDFSISSPLALQGSYIPMMPSHSLSCRNRPQPPAKPPRKSISPNLASLHREQSPAKMMDNCYEFLFLANTGLKTQHENKSKKNNAQVLNYLDSHNAEYVEMSLQNSNIPAYENHEIICSNGVCRENTKAGLKPKDMSLSQFSEILPLSVKYENLHRKINSFNNLMPSKSTPALHASRHTLDHIVPFASSDKEFQVLKPGYLNFKQKRASIQIPTSPTNYHQPPTPDMPPPSPATAETGIHEKIRPINQEYKSKKNISRDIDTLTDEQLVATIGPSGEIQLTLATDNKCVSTENTFSSENPFEGLRYGSVPQSAKQKLPVQLPPLCSKFEFQPLICKNQQNIYENVEIKMESGHRQIVIPSANDSNIPCSNRSSLSVMSPFDEKAEWAEIADIMASFGGGITRESMFAQNMESNFAQTFRADSTSYSSSEFDSIVHWLSNLGLSQYENLLVINGFDDIQFLGGNIVEDQDLEEIGIENVDHRHKICSAAQRLPSVQPVTKLKGTPDFPSSVDDWLHSICLQEYSENFSNNNITDMDRALKLWEVELNTVLKITKIGHRKRILASLGDKHFEKVYSASDFDLTKLNLDLSELEIDDNVKNKNYKTKPETSTDETFAALNDSTCLRIRPPTQLMSDSSLNADTHQNVIEAQWRHNPDDLIKSSCSYLAKYLGSTLVKELRGMESTKKSIQKLRSSTRDIGKIPNIILSISYFGVKFIDAETQQLVCEHEIRNIHCACQDADDLCHFAYITKDHQTHNHYCHVFSSSSVDLASEIILTLGQAFEVAYQIAVHEKAGKNIHSWSSSFLPESAKSNDINESLPSS